MEVLAFVMRVPLSIPPPPPGAPLGVRLDVMDGERVVSVPLYFDTGVRHSIGVTPGIERDRRSLLTRSVAER